MRWGSLFGFALLGGLVQVVVLPHLSVWGVHPGLALVMAMTVGLLYGVEAGAATGLVAGFIIDLAVGRFLGLHALMYGIVGFGAGTAEENVFKDNILVPVAAALVASLVEAGTFWFLFSVFDRPLEASGVAAVLARSAAVNVLLAPLMYTWAVRNKGFFVEIERRPGMM